MVKLIILSINSIDFFVELLPSLSILAQVNQRIKQQNQLIKCNHCHATFTTEAALAEHSSAKHPDTGHVSTSLVYRLGLIRL